jgi:cytochrome c551/c552
LIENMHVCGGHMATIGLQHVALAVYLCIVSPSVLADSPGKSAPDGKAAMVTSAPSLAKAKNCLACHDINSKVVGPAYRDVARKYRGDPGATERLSAKIRNGGEGEWGQVPMPPNPTLTPSDVETLVKWVLSL